MPTQHLLALTVKSTSGSFTEDFNADNKAEKVLEEAIRRLHLNPSPAVAYVLKRESDGLVLNLSEKLGAQGIKSGDVILVQTSQAQDG
jgi:hypothetical protein